eukprot:g16564.t1
MICCPIGIVLSYLVEFVCSIREVLLACGFYLVCVSCLSCGFSVPLRVSFLIVFALTYYRLVWTPTMLDEMPMVEELFSRDKTASVLPYLLTMAGFGGNLWLEWRAGAAEKVAAQEEKEDVEPLWTSAAAVAEEGSQAVVKYDDLVLGLGRWGSSGLRNDLPPQWRCPDLVL